MIQVTILYPDAPGAKFDHDYYVNVHMPMSIDLLGPSMISVTVARGIQSPPWPEPRYAAVCTFLCRSREAYEDVFLPNMEKLQGDMPNYTDIESIVQLSEVDIHFTNPAEAAARAQ